MTGRRSRSGGKIAWEGKLLVGLGVVVFLGGLVGWAMYRGRVWQGKDRFTVIRVGNSVSVESFDPVTRKGLRLRLPDNLEIESTQGRGRWLAGALPRLAVKYGWQWVGESVGDTLGIGITAIDQKMDWWDRWEWWRNSSQIEWRDVVMDNLGLTEEVSAADGVKELKLTGNWADKAKDWFGSVGIMNEAVAVTVVNTTETAGLGSHAARVINSAGMQVVMVNNDVGQLGACEIKASTDTKNSLSLQFLQRVFKCKLPTFDDNGREEITVRLGQEYQKKWLGN